MRAEDWPTAKRIIKEEHVRVSSVDRVKGGLRINCVPRNPKKQKRKHPFTITIQDIRIKDTGKRG